MQTGERDTDGQKMEKCVNIEKWKMTKKRRGKWSLKRRKLSRSERRTAMRRKGKVGLITKRPSLSLQAQVTPVLYPSAFHTTNH